VQPDVELVVVSPATNVLLVRVPTFVALDVPKQVPHIICQSVVKIVSTTGKRLE